MATDFTPLLCISGWAQPADALSVLHSDAHFFDYQDCRVPHCPLEKLAAQTPVIGTAIGWSLGGWLLMRAIEQKKIAVRQLVLIAAPLQFVSTPDFPYGMDPLTFDLFVQSYRADPVRTSKRFSALTAKGDAHFSDILGKLGYWEPSAEKEKWDFWLDALGHGRQEDFSFADFPPTLVIQGIEDAVVPHAQGNALANKIPGTTLLMIEGCGHAPHLHDTDQVREAIASHAAQQGAVHAV